jgi:hypothetical protein
MSFIRKHRPSPVTAIALAALGVALGGAAWAAIPDSNGTIHACFQKTNGNLRVVTSSAECRAIEKPLSWNQLGPPGPPGGSGAVSDERASDVATASTAPAELGGPTVTVDAPASTGLVGVFARADIVPSAQGVCGKVYIHEPQGIEPALPVMTSCSTEHTVWTSPDFLNPDSGTIHRQGGSWLLFEVPAGSRSFSLEYSAECSTSEGCASTSATFRNRRLWVMPVR